MVTVSGDGGVLAVESSEWRRRVDDGWWRFSPLQRPLLDQFRVLSVGFVAAW